MPALAELFAERVSLADGGHADLLLDEPARKAEADDSHSLIVSAMLQVAEDAADTGDDPADALKALAALSQDPDRLRDVLAGGTLQKAWDESLHPRADDGRFGDKPGEHTRDRSDIADDEPVEVYDTRTGEVAWEGTHADAKQLLADALREDGPAGVEGVAIRRPGETRGHRKPAAKPADPGDDADRLPPPSAYHEFETGEPLIATVYRGEAAGGSGSGLAALGHGRYFGLEPAVAERFSKRGTVQAGRVSLERPVVVRSDDDMTALKQRAERLTGKDFGRRGNNYAGFLHGDQPAAFTAALQQMGYDGIVVTYKEAPGGQQLVKFPPPERSGFAKAVLRKAAKAVAHAPAGGVTVQGTEYAGGEFIPGEVMDRATDAEKAAVSGGGGRKPRRKPAAATPPADPPAPAHPPVALDGGATAGHPAWSRVEGVLRSVLGRPDAQLADLSAVVGAMPEAAVVVDSPVRSQVVTVKVRHPDYWADYAIQKDADGPFLYVKDFHVQPAARGGGLATTAFAPLFTNAKRAGFRSVRLHAAKGNPREPDRPHNGYYTWAVFGFDQSLTDPRGIRPQDEATYQAARAEFPAAKTIGDILASPGGREWWKANGADAFDMRFDLTDGSKNAKMWETYLEAKRAARPRRADPPDARPGGPGADPGPDAGGGGRDVRGASEGVGGGHVTKAVRLTDDTHALLVAAMLQVAEDAAGTGDDPTDALKALADLSQDPDRLREVLAGGTLQKAWSEDLHPRDKAGRFISKEKLQAAKSDPALAAELRERVAPKDADKLEAVLSGDKDPGRTRRGEARHQSRQRRAATEADRRRAHRLAMRAFEPGGLGYDDYEELAELLPSLTVEQLRSVRAAVGASWGGQRLRRQGMVDTLVAFARQQAAPPEQDAPGSPGWAQRMMNRGDEPKAGGVDAWESAKVDDAADRAERMGAWEADKPDSEAARAVAGAARADLAGARGWAADVATATPGLSSPPPADNRLDDKLDNPEPEPAAKLASRLDELEADASRRLAEAERPLTGNRYADVSDADLGAVRHRLAAKVAGLKQSATATGDEAVTAEAKAARDRLAEADAELSRRVLAARLRRRLQAVQESRESGRLTVSESEMRELLAQAKDAYREDGLRGRVPYSPDHFRTSDLTGAKVRHFVELPDGRIAHPDELTQAQRRGRLNVVPDAELPGAFTTARTAEQLAAAPPAQPPIAEPVRDAGNPPANAPLTPAPSQPAAGPAGAAPAPAATAGNAAANAPLPALTQPTPYGPQAVVSRGGLVVRDGTGANNPVGKPVRPAGAAPLPSGGMDRGIDPVAAAAEGKRLQGADRKKRSEVRRLVDIALAGGQWTNFEVADLVNAGVGTQKIRDYFRAKSKAASRP